jgi:hypothetical protein
MQILETQLPQLIGRPSQTDPNILTPEQNMSNLIGKIASETRNLTNRTFNFVRSTAKKLGDALDEGSRIHDRQKRMAEDHFRSNAFYLRSIY